MFWLKQKRNLKKSEILALLLITFALTPLGAFAQTPEENQLFGYINSERAREHLAPLIWDDAVYRVALEHSKDMATTGQTVHKGTDGSEPDERIERAGIYSSRTGENIARDINVISAHTMLMESLYHRDNILEPDFTCAAVAIIQKNQFLYVTELFIHKIKEVAPAEARQVLIRKFNDYRAGNNFGPLQLSDSLSNVAQAHVDMQNRFDSLSPMLIMSSIARGNRQRTTVSVYTTTTLTKIPDQVAPDLKSHVSRLGIGFRRVRGNICTGGCYLVVLVFA
jgi:uncharacterized protein YkwD